MKSISLLAFFMLQVYSQTYKIISSENLPESISNVLQIKTVPLYVYIIIPIIGMLLLLCFFFLCSIGLITLFFCLVRLNASK